VESGARDLSLVESCALGLRSQMPGRASSLLEQAMSRLSRSPRLATLRMEEWPSERRHRCSVSQRPLAISGVTVQRTTSLLQTPLIEEGPELFGKLR
jgi:hypothetical protein